MPQKRSDASSSVTPSPNVTVPSSAIWTRAFSTSPIAMPMTLPIVTVQSPSGRRTDRAAFPRNHRPVREDRRYRFRRCCETHCGRDARPTVTVHAPCVQPTARGFPRPVHPSPFDSFGTPFREGFFHIPFPPAIPPAAKTANLLIDGDRFRTSFANERERRVRPPEIAVGLERIFDLHQWRITAQAIVSDDVDPLSRFDFGRFPAEEEVIRRARFFLSGQIALSHPLPPEFSRYGHHDIHSTPSQSLTTHCHDRTHRTAIPRRDVHRPTSTSRTPRENSLQNGFLQRFANGRINHCREREWCLYCRRIGVIAAIFLNHCLDVLQCRSRLHQRLGYFLHALPPSGRTLFAMPHRSGCPSPCESGP